ncbi:MAG TPA: bifunctional diaminohydroxyphosphoribosylaminopyrimidine deaminase/5-amino-6-(5-phosphoribosylamino)uracil reductase RibD [Pyrinomonadaceae bacterium]|nr:bifunctional diaminohydroxyphosphoribosylaminopyrimidine deaminase/5-amino-6-(5-phosphoribosylamino)uracil reductase RibD [Pyrinomonadaceae bacterium]
MDIRLWTLDFDERMMRRALELAARGLGQVSPSPLVGCVIASSSGEIVGEGFYIYEQVRHAETIALEQAGARARGATAYVTLEPHAHHGRTPPCTEALIKAGIVRVVVPIEDPNPLVSGKGFAHLRAAGVEVQTGLLEREAVRLNEAYIHSMRRARPFVHLKLACSLDGKIATRTGDSLWITGEESRARVHLLRHQYDAILIGAGTATADNPLLTDRSGKARRRPLVRVVLDKNLHLSPYSQLVMTARECPLVVFTSERADALAVSALERRGVEVIKDTSGGRDLHAVLQELDKRSIQSVLVEGGANVAGAFLDADLIDRASFFIAPIIIGGRDATSAIGGTGAQRITDAANLHGIEIIQRGRDVEITGCILRAEG